MGGDTWKTGGTEAMLSEGTEARRGPCWMESRKQSIKGQREAVCGDGSSGTWSSPGVTGKRDRGQMVARESTSVSQSKGGGPAGFGAGVCMAPLGWGFQRQRPRPSVLHLLCVSAQLVGGVFLLINM